jgi:hypothetical protein
MGRTVGGKPALERRLSYPPPSPDGPVSGQPWSSPSGDPLAAEPYQPPRPPSPDYRPGYAPLPPPQAPASGPPEGYQQTAQFPPQPGYPPPDQHSQYAPPGYGPPPDQQAQYAPPGYGPPPGYGQPPGYGAPPPPPPKRSNAPLIAVLLAVTLLLCAGGVTSVVLLVNRAKEEAQEKIDSLPRNVPTDIPELPTDIPGLPTDFPGLPTDLPTELPDLSNIDPDREISVEYEVTGDGPAEIIYVDKLGGEPQRVSNAKLPWRKKLTMKGSALVSVVAVRGDTSQGELTCTAKVDGEQVAEKTSKGTFITAACTKIVF